VAKAVNIAQLRPGDVLGGYELLLAVGAGGMGEVWAAQRKDAKGRGIVAIKTANSEMVGKEQLGCMLLDEARIAASIEHPNVCSIREVGAERGIPYLVMDWMDAGALLDLLSVCPDRRIDWGLAVRIVSDVAAGLHAAHELTGSDGTLLNVVHRDVSPQNILLSSAGDVKVADFGVAKARGQLHPPTETGEVKGKLSYMAPEQLTTKTFDRRADIFALGCCLYEATTGERPFHGGDALETMYRLLETNCVPPSALVTGFPSGLEAILLKALEKDPEKRYQTADDLRVALEAFLAQCGRLVTDRDISALVRARLGPALDAKTKALHDATQAIAARGVDADGPGFELTRSNLGAPESTRHTWNAALPGRTLPRRDWMVLLGVTLLVLLGGFAWSRAANPPSVVHMPVSASVPPASAAAPLVTITLRAEPAEASLRIDGGEALPSPQVIEVMPSQRLHLVYSSLDGYEPVTRQVSFDHSQELVLQLTPQTLESRPIAASATGKRPGAVPRAERRGRNQPDVSAVADPAVLKRRRTKRPIDSSNPFADP
jgi:serine/threonine protein kinase